MNENLNLAEKLKNVPTGTIFYTTTRGNCELLRINGEKVVVQISIDGTSYTYKYDLDKFERLGSNGECIIFPSKDQRDWNLFEYNPIKIGTPVMVGNCKQSWSLKYYAGNGKYSNQADKTIEVCWKHVIPVTEFDFINLCKKQ